MEALKSKKADLENKRSLFFQIGLIVTLIAVFMAFEYKSYDKLTIDDVYRMVDNTVEETIPVTVQEVEPLPVPPTPNRTIVVVDDQEETSDAPVIDATADQTTAIPYFEPIIDDEPPIIDDVPIAIPQHMPEFPGGLSQLYTFIGKNIKYPQLAKETNIQGTVFLNFIVEKDGSISNVNILRSIGGGCDEEAMRVVKAMPHWKPGIQMGEFVRVSYNLPIKFTLQN